MQAAAIAELDRRMGIHDVARIVAGNGGLARVVVTTAAAEGEVYLHGAHVTSWKPRGAEEVLFVSSQACWGEGQPIRGGIPVCFPWFGPKADDARAPMHGFARTTAWQLDSIVSSEEALTVGMSLESDAATKKWWPADFRLVLRVTFGSELTVNLVLRNTGTSSLRFEEALHTYLHVGDIAQTRVTGLDSVPYVDKVDSYRKKTQQGPIGVTSETDRIYLGTTGPVEVDDGSLQRRIEIAKRNSSTTVVWNPWIEKAKKLSDFGDDEWKRMICVETCNVGDFAVELAPGEQHEMQSSVRLGG